MSTASGTAIRAAALVLAALASPAQSSPSQRPLAVVGPAAAVVHLFEVPGHVGLELRIANAREPELGTFALFEVPRPAPDGTAVVEIPRYDVPLQIELAQLGQPRAALIGVATDERHAVELHHTVGRARLRGRVFDGTGTPVVAEVTIQPFAGSELALLAAHSTTRANLGSGLGPLGQRCHGRRSAATSTVDGSFARDCVPGDAALVSIDRSPPFEPSTTRPADMAALLDELSRRFADRRTSYRWIELQPRADPTAIELDARSEFPTRARIVTPKSPHSSEHWFELEQRVGERWLPIPPAELNFGGSKPEDWERELPPLPSVPHRVRARDGGCRVFLFCGMSPPPPKTYWIGPWVEFVPGAVDGVLQVRIDRQVEWVEDR